MIPSNGLVIAEASARSPFKTRAFATRQLSLWLLGGRNDSSSIGLPMSSSVTHKSRQYAGSWQGDDRYKSVDRCSRALAENDRGLSVGFGRVHHRWSKPSLRLFDSNHLEPSQ